MGELVFSEYMNFYVTRQKSSRNLLHNNVSILNITEPYI